MRRFYFVSLFIFFGAVLSCAASTSPRFAGGTSSTGWINFEMQDGKRIFIPVKINGHETKVLLVTGLRVSDMDKTFATSIGLHADEASDKTVSADSGEAHGITIQVGTLTLPDTSASLVDFAPLAQHIGHPLPMLLGDDAFEQLSVDIDFAHHRISFSKAGTQPKLEAAIEIPLTRVDDTPLVPVSIEGAEPAQFELGIGNSSEALIYQRYYDTHHLLDSRRTSKRLAAGSGGFIVEPVAELHRVQFAGFTFTAVPAAFIPASQTGTSSSIIAGDLGLPILSRFRLIIDYSHSRVYAVPYGDVTRVALPRDRLGLFVAKQSNGFVVKFVSPGSPAQHAGFKVGDEIATIDGKAAQSWPETAFDDLRYRPAGTPVVFRLQSGSTRSFKLGDYF